MYFFSKIRACFLIHFGTLNICKIMQLENFIKQNIKASHILGPDTYRRLLYDTHYTATNINKTIQLFMRDKLVDRMLCPGTRKCPPLMNI